MRHGSLFSGIGGFDLAAEWMGWENVFHCEWMPFPRKVLKYYWPKAISYENICTTEFSVHRGQIDILTGGFPCQPYSSAGKRLGKEDERHLWPEMLRAIKEIEPSWVVGENVRGLTNWNGGVVFEEVCADLENLGYEVQPVLLPAASVNAPHRRDRIWFVAYRNATDSSSLLFCGDGTREQSQSTTHRTWNRMGGEDASDSDSNGFQGRISTDINRKQQSKGIIAEKRISVYGRRLSFEGFPTQSPVCGGDDGLPTELDGIAFSKWRQESVKAYGNAIVPQVALQLFKVIQELSINK